MLSLHDALPICAVGIEAVARYCPDVPLLQLRLSLQVMTAQKAADQSLNWHRANHGCGFRHTPQSSSRVEEFQCRSEEHTSELQSLMRISYAVFCLNKKTKTKH